GNFVVLAMGFIDNGAQFVQGKGWNIVKNAIRTHEVTAVRIDFDPVSAKADLLTHGLARIVRPVNNLNAVRHRDVWRIAEQWISAGDIHSAGGYFHARPGNYSAIDGFFQINVSIARALGLKIADGGKAVIERAAHGSCAQNGPVGIGLLQQLLVIISGSDVTLQKNVRVRIDQAWQAGMVREINGLAAC